MAFDEELGDRLRELLAADPTVTERRMFGGLAFMVNGNMAVGIVGDDLMVRVGPEAHESALSQEHAREMDFAGRPMNGMVYVSPKGIASDEQLAAWVSRGHGYAASLPPKVPKTPKAPKTPEPKPAR